MSFLYWSDWRCLAGGRFSTGPNFVWSCLASRRVGTSCSYDGCGKRLETVRFDPWGSGYQTPQCRGQLKASYSIPSIASTLWHGQFCILSQCYQFIWCFSKVKAQYGRLSVACAKGLDTTFTLILHSIVSKRSCFYVISLKASWLVVEVPSPRVERFYSSQCIIKCILYTELHVLV